MLVRLVISLTVLRTSSDAERDLEILALPHQVAVLPGMFHHAQALVPTAIADATEFLGISRTAELRWRHASSAPLTRNLGDVIDTRVLAWGSPVSCRG